MKRRNLRAERIRAGYSAEEFAGCIGLSRQAYQGIECGYRDSTYKTWIKIQEVLGLDNSKMWELYQKQD